MPVPVLVCEVSSLARLSMVPVILLVRDGAFKSLWEKACLIEGE